MKNFQKTIGNVTIEISLFAKNDVNEIHLFAKTVHAGSFERQLEEVTRALSAYLSENGIPGSSVVFTRYFVSDYANQEETLRAIREKSGEKFGACAVSIVQQPPLNDNKIVVWAYIVHDEKKKTFAAKTVSANDLILTRGAYRHVWSTQLSCGGPTESAQQTEKILTHFGGTLERYGYTIKDNCIRTWLFVKDVDFNYRGVVEARREFFEKLDMTKDTHFISSTGIEGRHADPEIIVLMDAYSIGGVVPEQIRFLEAPQHLNPTHEYGVTFERGTSIDFGDRRHIYLSGTASIDNRGEIVHRNDVNRQVERAITNIAALLDDAEATLHDVAQMIVYLRDVADTEAVNRYLAKHHPQVPKVVVLAPVCRPGWLVEIECIAIKDTHNPLYADF
jgi:enamine deaminase RidA (YjgF/YER057c/UK114 family)